MTISIHQDCNENVESISEKLLKEKSISNELKNYVFINKFQLVLSGIK